MAELKTRQTRASVGAFVDGIADERRRKECRAVMALMKKATGAIPRMWGPSIVGFGNVRLRYDSGRELDWFLMGFSPRKQALTLYLGSGLDHHEGLLAKLGEYSRGKGCLYLKDLEQVKLPVLGKLLAESVAVQKRRRA